MMKNNNLVIIAGGSRSQSCSESTEIPKEFLDILGKGRTLIQQTLDRFKDSVEIGKIWVVTSSACHKIVKEQLPEINPDQILIETKIRNTAASIAYAAIQIKANNPYANLVISPADHIVLNTQEFTRVVNTCLNYSDENSEIVCIGIYPSRSETAYGYIQSNSHDPSTLKQVLRFIEKPSLYKAKEYLQTGNYYWNTGIYFATVKTLECAYHKYLPVLAREIDEHNTQSQSLSIEKGILEKYRELKVFIAEIGWTDAYSSQQDLEDILENQRN